MIEGQASGARSPKLRYGMIGGGQGAFIGDVHRKAIAMDGKAELVCRLLLPDLREHAGHGRRLGRRRRSASTGRSTEMIAAEAHAARPARLRRHRHARTAPTIAVAKLALEHGFPVVCDKPLTTSSARRRGARPPGPRDKGLLFCVTYTYSRLSHRQAHARHDRRGRARRHPLRQRPSIPRTGWPPCSRRPARSRPPGGPTRSAPASPTASATSAATSRTWSPT